MRLGFVGFLVILLLGVASSLEADILYRVMDLGSLRIGAGAFATAINAAGQITGASPTSSDEVHAFLYSNGDMRDVDTVSVGRSTGWAINNAGHIAGQLDDRAFVYSNGQIQDLANLSTVADSTAFAINDAEQIAGQFTVVSLGSVPFTHAFLYSNGQVLDLGTLGGVFSQAFGINDAGCGFRGM